MDEDKGEIEYDEIDINNRVKGEKQTTYLGENITEQELDKQIRNFCKLDNEPKQYIPRRQPFKIQEGRQGHADVFIPSQIEDIIGRDVYIYKTLYESQPYLEASYIDFRKCPVNVHFMKAIALCIKQIPVRVISTKETPRGILPSEKPKILMTGEEYNDIVGSGYYAFPPLTSYSSAQVTILFENGNTSDPMYVLSIEQIDPFWNAFIDLRNAIWAIKDLVKSLLKSNISPKSLVGKKAAYHICQCIMNALDKNTQSDRDRIKRFSSLNINMLWKRILYVSNMYGGTHTNFIINFVFYVLPIWINDIETYHFVSEKTCYNVAFNFMNSYVLATGAVRAINNRLSQVNIEVEERDLMEKDIELRLLTPEERATKQITKDVFASLREGMDNTINTRLRWIECFEMLVKAAEELVLINKPQRMFVIHGKKVSGVIRRGDEEQVLMMS